MTLFLSNTARNASSNEYVLTIIIIALTLLMIYLIVYLRFFWTKKKSDKLEQDYFRTKQELEEYKRQLEIIYEASNRQSIFTTNVSSEMRTPLNSIYGFAELLNEQRPTGSEYNTYVQMILNNAQNLLNIVNDTTDISRIEKGLFLINNSRQNLNKIINDADRFVRMELRNQNMQHIQIRTVKYLSDGDSCFLTDEHRLAQVLVNLLKNAIRFTKEGYIEFGYKLLEEKFVLFFVSDSGIGFSKDDQNNIFDEFYRIEGIDSKRQFGFGLSLVLSKKIVEHMGGKMWVESVKGSGSTFYFTIPCEPCNHDLQPQTSPQTDLASGCWSDRTILIVDDYKDIYYYFSETLAYTGIRFFYAENGFRAIELCEQHPEIELVLMDIQMPEMSGFEATQKIRKLRKQLPIIAQTAHSLNTDYDVFLDAGFNDLISKPIEKRILLEKISKYLNR